MTVQHDTHQTAIGARVSLIVSRYSQPGLDQSASSAYHFMLHVRCDTEKIIAKDLSQDTGRVTIIRITCCSNYKYPHFLNVLLQDRHKFPDRLTRMVESLMAESF